MYPAQELIDGIYSDDDLPDEIQYPYIFQGVPAGSIILQRSGRVYSGQINNAEFKVEIVNSSWTYTIKSTPQEYGPNGSGPCLFLDVLGYPLKDTFKDTYYYSAENSTFPSQSFSNVALNRISLCKWQASSSDISRGYLHYVSSVIPDGVRDYWLVGGLGIDGTVSSPNGLRLNIPVGAYNNRFLFSNISISE
jgi:hypothetical protein